MTHLPGRRIAIVGGGPGERQPARLLQQGGAEVVVYERDQGPDARGQGGTLDLHEEAGLRVLDKASLIGEFRARYRPGADHVTVADQNAVVHWKEAGGGDGAERPEIDRGPLRDLLLASLEPNTVGWGRSFTALTPVGDALRLEFAGGAAAMADLVIAADGANSRLRPYLTPLQPLYSGITVVEGNVPPGATVSPEIHALVNGGKVFAVGDEKTLIVSSKGDGGLDFYIGQRTGEGWSREAGRDFSDRADVLEWFRREFSGWSRLWNALFDNATLPLIPRPQYYMPLDQTWDPQPHLTMIGDAAAEHVMPPYAGEGVNMAMLDALELAEALLNDRYSNTQAAVAAYEAAMRDRASAMTRMTLEQTDALHSATALVHLLALFGGAIAAA